MKCTDCTKPIRPLVAVDIDGTLGNYHQHFTTFAARYWDLPYGIPVWDGEGDFETHLGLTKDQYRQAKLAYRQGGMKRTLPVFPGAMDLIKTLNELCEVWIATSRPWQRLDNIDPDTVEWLRRHGMKVDGLVYGDDKYEQLCSVTDKDRIVAVVDDLPEQMAKAHRIGLHPIQAYRPHNAGPRRWQPGSNSLLWIRNHLINLIAEWESTHGNV